MHVSPRVPQMLYMRQEMDLPLSVDPNTGLCQCESEPLGWLFAASPLLPLFPRLDFDECWSHIPPFPRFSSISRVLSFSRLKPSDAWVHARRLVWALTCPVRCLLVGLSAMYSKPASSRVPGWPKIANCRAWSPRWRRKSRRSCKIGLLQSLFHLRAWQLCLAKCCSLSNVSSSPQSWTVSCRTLFIATHFEAGASL